MDHQWIAIVVKDHHCHQWGQCNGDNGAIVAISIIDTIVASSTIGTIVAVGTIVAISAISTIGASDDISANGSPMGRHCRQWITVVNNGNNGAIVATRF